MFNCLDTAYIYACRLYKEIGIFPYKKQTLRNKMQKTSPFIIVINTFNIRKTLNILLHRDPLKSSVLFKTHVGLKT